MAKERAFLYATPDLTVDDTRYLQMEERVYRRATGPNAERLVSQIKIHYTPVVSRLPSGADKVNGVKSHFAGHGVRRGRFETKPNRFKNLMHFIYGQSRSSGNFGKTVNPSIRSRRSLIGI